MKEYIFQHSAYTTLFSGYQDVCIFHVCLPPQDILENETCCFKATRVLSLCKKLNKLRTNTALIFYTYIVLILHQ